MAANSEEQVFNFEGNLESGWQQFFAAKILELQSANEPQTLPEDFISVMVELGAATDKAIHKPSGASEYSQYDFSVDFVSQDLYFGHYKEPYLDLDLSCLAWTSNL